METHLHIIAKSQDISGEMRKAKFYTARRIVDCLKKDGPDFFLKQFKFFKKRHKGLQIHQVWQEGIHPKLILDERMLEKTMQYVHYNPVKRGYVDKPEHWRYSSARDYAGLDGLVEIVRLAGLEGGAFRYAFPGGAWERWAEMHILNRGVEKGAANEK